jgi:hypothetical protein
MKKILLGLVGAFALSLSFQSCKEDIELIGEYEETAVVYGLLDQADSLHMIKITRAFLGPGNALEIAQIPDSSYFKSVEGTITEVVNGTVLRTFVLRDTIVENKETGGAFYAPTQKLYYFATTSAAPLRTDATYNLDLDINNGAFEVSGKTTLVSNLTSNNISNSNQPYRFIDNNDEYISTSVTTSTGSAYRVHAQIDIEYTEWEGSNPTVRHALWTLGESDVNPPNDSKTFVANGATFYSVIKQSCSSNPAVTRRTLNSMTTILTGANSDLVEYMQVNEPSSSLAQSKPSYTNLTATNGANVIGIFSARQTVTIYKPFIDSGGNSNVRCINKLSTEELCVGSITGSLLFCSEHPADNIVGQEEPWACN